MLGVETSQRMEVSGQQILAQDRLLGYERGCFVW